MKQSNIIGNRKEYYVRNLGFNYDRLNDLFYAYKKNSSVYSNVMIGEFHLEFNKQGELIGVEILKASELLGEYGIQKRFLENADKVELKVVLRNNSLLIFIVIRALDEEKSATITLNNFESPIMQAIEAA